MINVSEHFFQSLCDHVGFILIAVSPRLDVQFLNRQAVRHFGDAQGPIVGRPFPDLLPEESRDQARTLLTAAIERGEAADMEMKSMSSSGEKKTFVLIISPIAAPGGERIGASVSMRDISERKRLSQQLSRSRRMAALGNMAEGIVHHFNNILGAMLTSIDSALPSESPRELRRALRLLSQAIGKATRITKQLEAFAEVEHERPGLVPLDNLLAEFVAKLARTAAATRNQIETTIDAFGPLHVSQRLMPVLESLSQNSLDAMPGGGVLRVTAARVDQSARIVVSDNGRGISDQDMERLFEPFFTTKGELAGGASSNTGLGLAAVHGLVKEMNGTIQITSRQGAGTRVELHLPLLTAEEAGSKLAAD